jgi:DNA-3-methyladenine glycosylase
MKLPPLRHRLNRAFYDQPTSIVARHLLGKALLRRIDGRWVGGIIVETEAYLSDGDLASHSHRGRTPSNDSMFQKAGTLYVYPIHAKHCLNAVTEKPGQGSAVLIRAIHPLWGIDVMQVNRGFQDLGRLTRGPAMLCQALNVDRADDGLDLVTDANIAILAIANHGLSVAVTPRIGISKSCELPLRFMMKDSPFISRRWSS